MLFQWLSYTRNKFLLDLKPGLVKRIIDTYTLSDINHERLMFPYLKDTSFMFGFFLILRNCTLTQFDQIIDITYTQMFQYDITEPRYYVMNYIGASTLLSNRITVTVFLLPKTFSVLSISPIYNSIEGNEREIFEKLQILFKNHKNLSRILLDYAVNY